MDINKLKIDIDIIDKNNYMSIQELIFNIFYFETNKDDNIYLFFPIIALYLYQNITNNKINFDYYFNIINKNLKTVNKNKDFFKMVIIFKKIMYQISKITHKNLNFNNKNNVIISKKINQFKNKEKIYDNISKKLYNNIKNKVYIIKNGKYLIKKYIFYNNYCIVSIIREIILQIYAFILLKKFKKYIIIPKIYEVKLIKHNNLTYIFLIMKYINIENKIERSLKIKKSLELYFKIKYFLDYLEKNKLYHNDTHNQNLIILKKKIILLDFGKSTLYYKLSPSLNGFPNINYLTIYIKKYIKIIMNNFIFKENIKNNYFLFNLY